MAAALIGISVVVALNSPPNTILHGFVSAVNPETTTLELRDGEFCTIL
jgi:enhancer of mRNA-decapping protein 3